MGESVGVRCLGVRWAVAVWAALAALASGATAAAAAGPVSPPELPPPVTLPVAGAQAAPAAQSAQPHASASGQALVGLFALKAGNCTSGSTFRMISSSGSDVSNSDSPCSSNQAITPLSPGTDGGLSTTGYQPDPNPAFDGTGNGLAGRITKPQKFFGNAFAASTNATDPQTGTAVAKPVITNSGGTLGGDLRAFSAAWNSQHFNQGSPKPDGTNPGQTAGPTGTYNAGTGAFTLDWSSTIVGGPFNGFTGKWHLEGTFKPSSSAQTASGSTVGGSGSSGSGAPGTAVAASSSGTRSSSGPGGTTTDQPFTGPPFPPALGFVPLVLGGLGLLLRRRVATSGFGAENGGGGPAGGRARRP